MILLASTRVPPTGCEFDHLWVMGLSVDAWPLAARPNPFLPLALQREAGIPESSAQASLELDRRITQGWLAAQPLQQSGDVYVG